MIACDPAVSANRSPLSLESEMSVPLATGCYLVLSHCWPGSTQGDGAHLGAAHLLVSLSCASLVLNHSAFLLLASGRYLTALQQAQVSRVISA